MNYTVETCAFYEVIDISEYWDKGYNACDEVVNDIREYFLDNATMHDLLDGRIVLFGSENSLEYILEENDLNLQEFQLMVAVGYITGAYIEDRTLVIDWR